HDHPLPELERRIIGVRLGPDPSRPRIPRIITVAERLPVLPHVLVTNHEPVLVPAKTITDLADRLVIHTELVQPETQAARTGEETPHWGFIGPTSKNLDVNHDPSVH